MSQTKANLDKVIKGVIPYPTSGESVLSTKTQRHLAHKHNPAIKSVMRASCKSVNSYFHSRARSGAIRGGGCRIMGWNVSGARHLNPGSAKDRDNLGIKLLGKSEIKPAPGGPKPGNSSPSVYDQSLS